MVPERSLNLTAFQWLPSLSGACSFSEEKFGYLHSPSLEGFIMLMTSSLLLETLSCSSLSNLSYLQFSEPIIKFLCGCFAPAWRSQLISFVVSLFRHCQQPPRYLLQGQLFREYIIGHCYLEQIRLLGISRTHTDICLSFWLSLPLDCPHLKPSRNRCLKDIISGSSSVTSSKWLGA